MAFSILLAAIVIAIALGLFVATANDTPSSSGEVSQSPFVYLIFLLLIFTMGFLLSRVLTGDNSKFSFFTFINVSLAGVLVSGLAHEFVHILLINHPVQLRFHFGDARAIFSTCCLSPGEVPYEGIAYGIQFLILVAWMFLNRHTFYNGQFRGLWKKDYPDSSSRSKKGAKIIGDEKNVSKKNVQPKNNEMDEDGLEREWRANKSQMEGHLVGKTKPGKKDSDLEDDISKIGRLKA